MRSSPRSSNGPTTAFRTIPAHGSWRRRSIARSTRSAARSSCGASTRSSAASSRRTAAKPATSARRIDEALDDEIGDDMLSLMFVACHPVLAMEARVALTLRMVGGLTTAEIARAFLVPEPTIAQRIVRAKRTLAEARVPFEVPRGEALAERLASVLEVVYLVFNEGYSATAGDDWLRPALCDDALRLGRMLAELAPRRARGPRPRRAARDPGFAQRRADSARRRAGAAARAGPRPLGPLADSARPRKRSSAPKAWAARSGRTRCRPRSRRAMRVRPRPRRRTGRASSRSTMRSRRSRRRRSSSSIAPSRSRWRSGPPRRSRSSTRSSQSAALEVVSPAAAPCAAICSSKLGRFGEARAEFERAASLTRNERERRLMQARAEACGALVAPAPLA